MKNGQEQTASWLLGILGVHSSHQQHNLDGAEIRNELFSSAVSRLFTWEQLAALPLGRQSEHRDFKNYLMHAQG